MNHELEISGRRRLSRKSHSLGSPSAQQPRHRARQMRRKPMCTCGAYTALKPSSKPAKKTIGKPLPSYDALATRIERNIFFALGLAAIFEIGITASHGLLFAGKLEDHSLSSPVDGSSIKTISA